MKTTVANNDKTTRKPGGVTGKGFKPGKSGNPTGRPKSADFAEAVRDFLSENDPKAKGDQPRLRGLLERLVVDDPKILLYFAFGKPGEIVQPKGQNDTALPPHPKQSFDPGKLTVEELIQISALIEKGSTGVDPDIHAA